MAALFGWGARWAAGAPAEPVPAAETAAPTVVLPKFLRAVEAHASPTVLDLGPCVGRNVAFLGDRLSCRLLIADLEAELATGPGLVDAVLTRLSAEVASPLHGVLCWDVFDYLDRAAAQAVGRLIAAHLVPGGVVHGLFGTTAAAMAPHARYVIQDACTFHCRPLAAPAVPRMVHSTRDLTMAFAGLTVCESVLLKTQRREILLKKT